MAKSPTLDEGACCPKCGFLRLRWVGGDKADKERLYQCEREGCGHIMKAEAANRAGANRRFKEL